MRMVNFFDGENTKFTDHLIKEPRETAEQHFSINSNTSFNLPHQRNQRSIRTLSAKSAQSV